MENLERAQPPFEDSPKDVEAVPEEHELLDRYFTSEQIGWLKERTKELVERVAGDDFRLVIFLDRSARPISWMFRAAWEKYAGGKPIPKIKFVNIGAKKKKLFNSSRSPSRYGFHSEEEYQKVEKEYWDALDSDEYTAKVQRDIGSLFTEERTDSRGFSSKGEILIVDEFVASGFSVGLAEAFFRKQFPGIPVKPFAFFSAFGDLGNTQKYKGFGGEIFWHQDKTYTLLSDEKTHPRQITAEAERDEKKRARGVQLKKELEGLFKGGSEEQEKEKTG